MYIYLKRNTFKVQWVPQLLCRHQLQTRTYNGKFKQVESGSRNISPEKGERENMTLPGWSCRQSTIKNGGRLEMEGWSQSGRSPVKSKDLGNPCLDAGGILLVDCLEGQKTINVLSMKVFLRKLTQALAETGMTNLSRQSFSTAVLLLLAPLIKWARASMGNH